MTDIANAQQHLVAIYESDTSNPQDCSVAPYEVVIPYVKAAADTNGTDATSELVLGWVPRNAKLVSAKYVPTAALNVDVNAGNFATIILQSRATNGANILTLSTITTKPTANSGTGNWTAWNSVDLNPNAYDPTNNYIPAGGCVTFKVTKTNGTANTALPAGTLTVRIQYV